MSTLKNSSRQIKWELIQKKLSAFMKNDPPLKLLRSSEKDEEKRLINSGEELGVIHVGAE